MSTAIPSNAVAFTTGEVAAATRGTIVRGDAARSHVGATTDSRAVGKGSIFVALRGEKFDGHAFVDGAVKGGSSLVIVERNRGEAVGKDADVVEVADTLEAWGDLAHAHFLRWKSHGGRIVAITGSAGKTTTKELCAALLDRVADGHATRGNLNNRVGLPAVVLGLEEKHAFAVLEMGMSEPGEIARLTAIAPPDVSVVTNIGLAHAGGVGGTREDVAREKGTIFEATSDKGTIVINADDPFVVEQAKRSRAKAVMFGRAERAIYRLIGRESLGAKGSRLDLERPAGSLVVDFPLVGEGPALDFVAALAAAEAVSGVTISTADLAAALAAIVLPSGRASVSRLADGTIVVDDSYNANPDSMRSAIESLAEIAACEGRRAVAVVGEMRELGAGAEAAHDKIGDVLAANKIALVIGCGGLADRALARAEAKGVPVRRAKDARGAAKLAVAEIGAGDVVLVKASRGVAAEVVVEALEQARGGKVS